MTGSEDFIDELIEDTEEVKEPKKPKKKATKTSTLKKSNEEFQKLFEELKLLDSADAVEDTKLSAIIKEQVSEFAKNYRQLTNPTIRYNIIFANCESQLSNLKNTVKVNFYVLGKDIKYWPTSDSYDARCWGILINPTNSKERCPAFITQSYPKLEQTNILKEAKLATQYKLNVSIAKEAELDYNSTVDKPQYLNFSEVTNFKNPIRSKRKLGVITAYKQYYSVDVHSVIESMEGREDIACGISERSVKKDGTVTNFATNFDNKLLLVLPQTDPRPNMKKGTMSFRAVSLGDPHEKIQIFTSNFDEFKGWEAKKTGLVIAGQVSHGDPQYGAKYTFNAIGIEEIDFNAIAKQFEEDE